MASGIKRTRSPDLARAERALAEFMSALGFDEESDELAGTPARVARAYGVELLSGYEEELATIVHRGSEETHSELDPILVRGVRVAAVCPHHLLVAEGIADVAYHPGARLVGLGALARLVTMAASRLTFQEQIASDVVGALMEAGAARGAYCRVELNHACLRSRGARETEASVASFARAGSLSDPALLGAFLGRRDGGTS